VFREFTFAATIIFQTSDGYGNTPKARIRSTGTGDDYIDWRTAKINGIPGSSGGETNDGNNVGTGTGEVYRDKIGATLNFKTLKEGTGVSITNGADDITLTATGAATDLNEAYDNFGATPATITVDNAQGQGSVQWDLNGDQEHIIDVSSSNSGKGMVVQNGADEFELQNAGANNLKLITDLSTADLFASGLLRVISTNNVLQLQAATSLQALSTNADVDIDADTDVTVDAGAGVSIDAATASNLTVSGATADLTLGARAATVTLNQSGDTALSGFTATSLIGALNELQTDKAAAEIMIVEDQKTQGTNGGTSSVGYNDRTLSTVVVNEITGASLSSNQITLPAGRYIVRGYAPGNSVDLHNIALTNTSNVIQIDGTPEMAGYVFEETQSTALLEGRLNISSSTTYKLRHYTARAVTGYGLGKALNVTSRTEIYSRVVITRLGANV
jgi:hypothetical protein